MSTPHSLADCCRECGPWDDACTPLTVTEEPDRPGSLCAFYRCPRSHEWQCWWDAKAAEWPAEWPAPRRGDAAA